MIGLSLEIFIGLVLLAFFCGYIAITLGMGYGMMLVPILLLLGFRPLQVVPVILISEFISGTIAALFHHKFENVNFTPGTSDFKIAVIISICNIIGTVIAVFVAVNISQLIMELIIGIIILSMGIIVLIMRDKSIRFSWSKITTLGIVAAFNKGISGGGYGPLITGGQILSGVPARNAVAVTSLAKSVTCLTGFLMYLYATSEVNFLLVPPLVIGALFSVPFATFTVKRISQEKIKFFIATLTILLGAVTIIRIFL
jgi:uncharacterized membrane protein YfcA